MPEQFIEDFTTDNGVENGDIWHIQRLQGGVWRDFQVRNRYMFGLDIASAEATYSVQSLVAGAQVFQTPLGTGEIYIPMKTYAVYTPGNTVDNAAIRLIGHINFESGGNNGLCAGFKMTSDVQGSGLRSSDVSILFTSPSANWTFRITDPTTADGFIRVFAAFAVVTI